MARMVHPETVAIVERILAELQERDRSIAWLARRSGMSYSLLYSRLKRNPQKMTVGEVITISDALQLPFGVLVGVR